MEIKFLSVILCIAIFKFQITTGKWDFLTGSPIFLLSPSFVLPLLPLLSLLSVFND